MGIKARLDNIENSGNNGSGVLNDISKQTFYDGMQGQYLLIDNVDALFRTASDYRISSMIITKGKIKEITYSNDNLVKEIKIDFEKLLQDLNELKTDESGYYRLQYGIDTLLEYFYEPMSPFEVISLRHHHIDYYNQPIFDKLKEAMDNGNNVLLCGDVNFASMSTIFSNLFKANSLVCVNAPYITSSSCIHFNPSLEQERAAFSFISNRKSDVYAVLNEPKDIEGALSLWYKRGKILLFFPYASAQETISLLENYLISDFSKKSFVKRLDGAYVVSHNERNVVCKRNDIATPLTRTGKMLLEDARIFDYKENKLYVL